MKKLVFIISCVLCFSIVVFGGAFIDSFNAKSENGNVTIEWKTKDESGVKQFEIERSAAVSDAFITIAFIPAKGNNSTYQYVDKTAYKTTDAVYKYRIKIVDYNSNTSYSGVISVANKVSSVKSTWGSIKSMFR